MKYLFFVFGLLMLAVSIPAEDRAGQAGQTGLPKQPGLLKQPLFTWNLLWAGSWEESKTLQNRGDFRLGLTWPGLLMRGQYLDKRPFNFELDPPWDDPASKGITGASFGMYHKATGSRFLYGILDEWGLPARIRSPWIRSAPYTENHKPIMADLRTTTSSTKEDEAYLYLSSPRLTFFKDSALPEIAMRGFASAQSPVGENVAPAFSGGLETLWGKNYELLLEGFYTGTELPAKKSSSWFSDPPPLPDRDFRLGAAGLMLNTPYVSLSSDWAWSETFAWGSGLYGNAGIRLTPPLPWIAAGKPGPWSLSLAADGMGERYVGRDGTSPGGGLRTAGKIEWKGARSSLFRVNTTLRGPGMDEPFERSSSGIYYRFPAASNRVGSGEKFPLRISRISFNADRNASDLKKIHDSFDGTLGLSLNLPPMLLPRALLSASASKIKNPKPQMYPLNIHLSAAVKELGSTAELPSPYPFSAVNQEFDSLKTSGELLWSPGIFQFRTRWAYTAYPEKDNQLEGSFSTAVRFKHGRFSTKIAWPVFPEKWNCTLSWRVEK
ncbi:MAG: hypothetical protein LBB89_13360 [Treponema sp.]|jgi:hypothetical protein|nr:hypothetical protein [Treponema sp.]